MPKMKSNRAAAKRFKKTANGKIKHRHSGTSHLAARMTHKRKRNLRGTTVLDKVENAHIVKALAGNSY